MNPKFTDRAIAYLKAVVPDNDSPSVALSLEDSTVIRPLAEDLCICYVVDKGTSYHYVQQRHLIQDGISEVKLHETGILNLVERVSKRVMRVQPYQNIFAVLMGGNFEASLILLDHYWEDEFRSFVSGDYSFAIPARDILAFCDSTSPQGINELRQLIARITPNGDHLISDKVWMRQNGKIFWRSSD